MGESVFDHRSHPHVTWPAWPIAGPTARAKLDEKKIPSTAEQMCQSKLSLRLPGAHTTATKEDHMRSDAPVILRMHLDCLVMFLLLASRGRPKSIEPCIEHVFYRLVAHGREEGDQEESDESWPPLEVLGSVGFEPLLGSVHLFRTKG